MSDLQKHLEVLVSEWEAEAQEQPESYDHGVAISTIGDCAKALRAVLVASEPEKNYKKAVEEIEDFLTTTIGIGRVNPERAFSPERIEKYEYLMKKWFPEAWAMFEQKQNV